MNLEDELHALMKGGADTESLLSMMRRSGCTKVESIKRLMQLTGIPLPQAKAVVHDSDSWKDLRESHDEFQEQLTNSLRERDIR